MTYRFALSTVLVALVGFVGLTRATSLLSRLGGGTTVRTSHPVR